VSPSNAATAADEVILEVLPGQAWILEDWQQPLYSTLGRGRGVVLVGPSGQGPVLPFAGLGAEGEREMYEKHLNRVHLPQLSPVMWSWQQGYPRKELGVPIKPAYNAGMGSYETATPINPKGSPVWSDTWQQRAAGAFQRVSPYALGNGAETASAPRPWYHWAIGMGLVGLLGVAVLKWTE